MITAFTPTPSASLCPVKPRRPSEGEDIEGLTYIIDPSATVTSTGTRTATPTPTISDSSTPSTTSTGTTTASTTNSATNSRTPTTTPSASNTGTPTSSISLTPSNTSTSSNTPTRTPPSTGTATGSASRTAQEPSASIILWYGDCLTSQGAPDGATTVYLENATAVNTLCTHGVLSGRLYSDPQKTNYFNGGSGNYTHFCSSGRVVSGIIDSGGIWQLGKVCSDTSGSGNPAH